MDDMVNLCGFFFFFFSSRRRHTRFDCDWSSDVCSSDLMNVTAVRVPVFYGHGEAVHLQTRRALGAAQARELLRKAPGVSVMDEPVAGGYPAAATEAAKRDTGYVGSIRGYPAPERGTNL